MSETDKDINSSHRNQVENVANLSNAELVSSTAENEQQQNEPAAGGGGRYKKFEAFFVVCKSLIIRALIIYAISSFFRGMRSPTETKTNDSGGGGGGGGVPAIQAKNIFLDGTPLTLYVYITESSALTNYSSDLFWLKEITYGDWSSGPNRDGIFHIEKDIPITNAMRNNGSLYLHAFVTKSGYSPDPKSKKFDSNIMTSMVTQLNRYKKLKNSKTKNLLTGETEKLKVEDGKIVAHWHPNFTINLITDQSLWSAGAALPAPLNQYLKFTDDLLHYKPILYPNDYWNMARDYQILNDSYTLKLTYQPIGFFKWQLYAAQAMRTSMFNMWGDTETQSEDEQDSIKETLLDTNPYLLGMTLTVSMLHSIFELLAFKNDIQFWNNRNSLEGLSVRSVFFSVFQSLIVLLYVLDNETNMLIKISCFVGLGIELWKIWKVIDIKYENGKIVFKDKGSYVESSTKVYDELAFKYLSWLCFPLLAGYCTYALLYLEHKGWYSFVLDILYGYLLTFGFIMMTPQLFINYKLKSIAHLPWRMLTYKFLNTFIDDMFAFVIKMPTMYRIGCFRDDIVFLIFLYQRWIYPVDKTRRNEFGYSAVEQEDAINGGEVVTVGDGAVEGNDDILPKKNQ